jgi:hypothetical protein
VAAILAFKTIVYCFRLLQEVEALIVGDKTGLLSRWQQLPANMKPRGLFARCAPPAADNVKDRSRRRSRCRSPSSGLPPLSLGDLPAAALLSMVRLALPAYAFVLAPIHLANLYTSLHPAWQHWFAVNDTRFMSFALLAEFAIMGLFTDWVVWHVTGQYGTPRIMVWPSISVVSSSVCDWLVRPYMPLTPQSYAALMALKWSTFNLAIFFGLPSTQYDAWAALFSTVMSVWMCVSIPIQQRMAARHQLH